MAKQIRPFVPQPDQVAGALLDIAYEMDQLLDVLEAWPPVGTTCHNAFLESCLVHVRVLLDFFEHLSRTRRDGTELDDVLCSDYGFRAEAVGVNNAIRERINKDVFHLSYSRRSRSLPNDRWNVTELLVPLLRRAAEFSDHVLATRATQLEQANADGWSRRATQLRTAIRPTS